MSAIAKAVLRASSQARASRAQVFRQHFPNIDRRTRILDVGSETGSNIHSVLAGLDITPANVHIADIDAQMIAEGQKRYGFTPVLLDQSGRLPFDDRAFDIVYCSSVIEHVTVPKEEVWTLRSGRAFAQRALVQQRRFAAELRRVGRRYFVQTPNIYFPIESHSWLPFMSYLPRPVLIPVLRLTNRFWVKRTSPDWHLLDRKQMQSMFPDAVILEEKRFGLVKSLMAVH